MRKHFFFPCQFVCIHAQSCQTLCDSLDMSDFTFTFHFLALEKEMATHSSVLAWRIPGTADPGGLPYMGSYRVGHDWSNLAAADYSPPGSSVHGIL